MRFRRALCLFVLFGLSCQQIASQATSTQSETLLLSPQTSTRVRGTTRTAQIMAPTGTVMDNLCRVRKTVHALHRKLRRNAETELTVSACTGAVRLSSWWC
jgi:hypothetical protein